MTAIEEAVKLYRDRLSGAAQPSGHYDHAERWYPAATEWRECCFRIRPPSRKWPHSYLRHCRTVVHVAALCGVDAAELRRGVAAPRRAPRREGGDNYYKAVAVVDGRMLSIYDGKTEYHLGRPVTAGRPVKYHEGGIYVYASLDDARAADVPYGSVLLHAPRAIIRVRAEGAYVRYGRKLAFTRVTPIEVVEMPNIEAW